MKKILFTSCFVILAVNVFGQQFSQYNTGSLFDSFENPSQRAFIPDTSRQFAFNFLLPSFNANFYLTGNAQTAFKTRLFSDYYNTAALQVGKGKNNHVNANLNAYSIMFKMFTSLDGDQEIGFFTNTKFEMRGFASDESMALFNGPADFTNNSYTNIFNDNYFYQAYHQVGFTYREQVSKRFAFGIKLSALSGISYRQVNITQSQIDFDKPNDAAMISLHGTARSSGKTYNTTVLDKAKLGFQNPGVSISIGTSYVNQDGYHFQYNLKDIGFIQWAKTSVAASFKNDSTIITDLSSSNRETNIVNAVTQVTTASQARKGFSTVTNGLAEVSVNKTYWLDYDKQYRFSPTLIASKELFYTGFTAALVTPVQYHNYTATLTTSYNDLKLLNFGGQFMIKSDNAEFYIGSDRLFQSISLLSSALSSSTSATQPQTLTKQGPYTGADFFIGVSFKFGSIIEHPMNASHIPTYEKGPLGKLYDKWFKKDKNY